MAVTKDVNIMLPHHYKARPYQVPFWEAMRAGIKRAVLVWHRRAGKEKTCWNYMITQACRKIGIYYYFFPHFSQGRKIIWDGIDKSGFRFLNHIPKDLVLGVPNSSEMKIRLHNGSLIQIIGSNNIDSIVGTNPCGCVFTEYSLQDPTAWQLMRPILRENEGWSVFNFTPRGANHAKELFDMANGNREWFTQLLTVDDTAVLTSDDIQKERDEGMSEDFIQQEFYCFPEGQFVMTSSGMCDIKDIKVGDLVFTHAGRFRKVLETHSRDYEGDLTCIKSFGSCEDLICTPNHPVRVYERHAQTYRWIQAQHVAPKHRVCFPKMLFGDQRILSRELALLIAWYVCEGSAGCTGAQFTVGTREEAKIILDLLNLFGCSSSLSNAPTAINVIAKDSFLVDFFKVHCGTCALDKKIPMHLIAGNESAFLNELIQGDGCITHSRGRERWMYTTISKTLAYQVQILANSLGYTAGITKRLGGSATILGREVMTQDSYVVQIGSVELRQESTTLIRAKYSIGACVNSVSLVPFSGKVYNLKVQYDESYTVNGRAVHNCSFTLGIEGSYYAKYLQQARDDDRIGSVPVDEHKQVFTAWDIGYGDSTAIVFYQIVGQEIHVVDFYENHGESLHHYAQVLKDKGYIYGGHYAPHDIDSHSFTTGLSAKEVGASLGVRFLVLPTLKITLESGIEAVRSVFPRIWIDEKRCGPLIRCLENYRKEFDQRLQTYKSRPLHDKYSHGADSFRYMALAVKIFVDEAKSGIDDVQSEKWFKEFNPRFE